MTHILSFILSSASASKLMLRVLTACFALFVSGCFSTDEGGEPPLRARWECDSRTDRARWLPKGSPDGDEYTRGNVYGLDVWWEGPSGIARALVTATLFPSRNPGSSSNTGEDNLPDFYFEDELNPDWQFERDETGRIPGMQALRVSSVLKAGERVNLIVSTFDWGGTFRIDIVARSLD